MNKNMKSFRLSNNTNKMISILSENLEMTKTEVIEKAIRNLYKEYENANTEEEIEKIKFIF